MVREEQHRKGLYNQTTIADKVKLNNKHNEKIVTAFLYPTHRRLSQSNTNELIDKSTFRIELAFSNKNSP